MSLRTSLLFAFSLFEADFSLSTFNRHRKKEDRLYGKLKFQITNQQITIQTKFSGLKIEDISKQNMQQCAAKFAAPDFPF
jgi:hypothetical protein